MIPKLRKRKYMPLSPKQLFLGTRRRIPYVFHYTTPHYFFYTFVQDTFPRIIAWEMA